jgi:hypothetical protein
MQYECMRKHSNEMRLRVPLTTTAKQAYREHMVPQYANDRLHVTFACGWAMSSRQRDARLFVGCCRLPQ